MCMRYNLITTLCLLFAGFSTLGAQQTSFQSKVLSKIAKAINYVPNDTLRSGVYDAGTAFGMPVVVAYDNRHTVTNIGFKLFTPEQKALYTSNVYDFLERYFLELYTWNEPSSIEQKLKDDKVMFTLGSFADVKRITPESTFTISRMEDKLYEVTWSNNTKPFLSIAFVIQYEILLGMTQEEAARTMYDKIICAQKYDKANMPDSLVPVKGNIYSTQPVKSYQIETLNDAIYYTKEAGDYKLIENSEHLNYLVTNALQMPTVLNNPIAVEQSVYGFKKLTYTVTLQQWINYCYEAKLNTYAAIEEEYDDALKVLVVAESKDLGYNHLLSFMVPRNFTVKPSAEIKCKMSAFIPIHNVKNLYQQYVNKPKKKY